MRALFGRKVLNLKELRELTNLAKEDGFIGTEYEVTKEIELSNEAFEEFANDFCKDQPWITEEDGGSTKNGAFKCIKVKNMKTKESILVNPEGYTYPRYTAIEK